MAINHEHEAAALQKIVASGDSPLLAASKTARALDPGMTTESGPATATGAPTPNSREGNPSSLPSAASEQTEPLSGDETQPTPKQETAAPSEGNSPRTIRLKVGGSEEEIPVDELGGIIEQARRVNTEERSQEEQIARQMIQWIKDENIDQGLKEHVMQAMKEGKIPTYQPAEDVEETEVEEDRPAPKVKRHQSDLEAKVQFLEQRERERIVMEQHQRREATLAQHMGAHQVFKDQATRDLALQAIRSELDARPNQDPKVVVQQMAARTVALIHAVRQSAASDANTRGGTRTAPAKPTGASQQAGGFSAKDLGGGALLEHMTRVARERNR